ncbi:MAG: cobalt-precorrin-6A reductase [Amylibacter sp.]|nr:cobalt-precorrin-6A reductase [Amylibacter sp.]
MTLLVLAGTSDARQLLEGLQGADVIASLAGVTRSPADLPVTTRKGGFGGVVGFRDYLVENGIKGVVDATHPFASKMTQTAAIVCAELGLPHIILQRPEWVASVGDDWHFVDSVAETATIIPVGSTVFLGTGRQTLAGFSCLEGRKLLARVIDPPQKPVLAEFQGDFLIGTPPFSIAEEVALFRDKGIEWLVVKNAGGQNSRSKLDAARELGLPVVMINRPKLPDAHVVGSVDAALKWVRAQAW